MRINLKKTKVSNQSGRRLSLTTVIVAIAILAIGAVTVASRQKLSEARAKAAKAEQRESGAMAAGNVHLQNPAQPVQLSDEELAAGLRPLINQSTEGLSEVHHGDGSVSINLDDRFQNVTVARVNQNGNLAQSCVDNPRSAGEFFDIDPKLIENRPQSPVAPKRNEDR